MKLARRIGVLVIAGLVVAAVLGVYYMPHAQQPGQSRGSARTGQRGATAANEAVPVVATAATLGDVPVYLDGVGTAKALNTVTVQSQVDGMIVKIFFKEGQDVEKGYVLAKIDPVTYQAAYDQTVAKKAQDEAQLANARLDLERYTKLVASNAVNKQQLDTQRATVAQLEAQIKLDQAAIDNARQILSWTDVVAPITGRTGIRLIDQGNIVKAASPSGLVILTQLRPISIFFNLPQQNLPELNKGFAEGPLAVDALGPDGKSVLDRGKVVVIDNQVDQTTGTVKLKAEFPNSNLQLWPGQFVNVRVLMDTMHQVIVVPTAAIQRGPNGTLVYVLRDNSTVTVRPVTVRQQDDVQAVVDAGLQAGERVVTTGFSRLTEGSHVTVSRVDGTDVSRPAGTGGARMEAGGQSVSSDRPPLDATQPARPEDTGQAGPGERSRREGTRGGRGAQKRISGSGTPPARNP
ncbi:MAG TPA: efflux RND transporter periplasmic adaptor subunit [Xanthobacteraceae bacterium]|jgi:multidrug efflux system membrane fusion protein